MAMQKVKIKGPDPDAQVTGTLDAFGSFNVAVKKPGKSGMPWRVSGSVVTAGGDSVTGAEVILEGDQGHEWQLAFDLTKLQPQTGGAPVQATLTVLPLAGGKGDSVDVQIVGPLG